MADDAIRGESAENIPNGHSGEIVINVEHGQEEVPERELTLTDHLNKRLLESFLKRLNQNEVPVAAGLNYVTYVPETGVEELSIDETEWDSDIAKADSEQADPKDILNG